MKVQAQIYTIGESKNRTTKVLASGLDFGEGTLVMQTLVKGFILTGWFATNCDPAGMEYIVKESGIVLENYSGERMTIKLMK